MAESLNDAGLDIRKTIELMQGEIDIPWTKNSIHDILWVTIQKSMYGKSSTTELTKQGEIDKIWEVMNRFLGERLHIESILFPSEQEMIKYNSKMIVDK